MHSLREARSTAGSDAASLLAVGREVSNVTVWKHAN
jgi:hypothetical protein